MKRILVLGGSPKGDVSVTMEHVRFLEKHLEGAEFLYEQPGFRIKKLERDGESFSALMKRVDEADILLLAMPVYYTLIPSGFKRFIELVNERGEVSRFRGKVTAVLMTSIQFYDHTALNYLQAVCEDWGCLFADALSLNMHDIFKKPGRELLLNFGRNFLQSNPVSLPVNRRFAPLPASSDWVYTPAATEKIPAKDRKIVFLSDGSEVSGRLGGMLEKARSLMDGEIKSYRLDDLIKGGCLGCLKCGADNRCAWEGKDGFIDAFREWMDADILIMGGTMKDRYLSSVWKSYFDRSFWRTHQSSFQGKRIVWLISGPLSHEQNLQEILYTYGELQEADKTWLISDEVPDSSALDDRIEGILRNVLLKSPYQEARPVTFRRVGGYKVFRDEVFGGLKLVFRRDHKTYRRTGVYDFPLKNPLKRLGIFLGYLVTGIPFINRKMSEDMIQNMIRPYPRLYSQK